jgi:hypothetical protein
MNNLVIFMGMESIKKRPNVFKSSISNFLLQKIFSKIMMCSKKRSLEKHSIVKNHLPMPVVKSLLL